MVVTQIREKEHKTEQERNNCVEVSPARRRQLKLIKTKIK